MYHGRSFLWSAGWCMLVGIWKAIRRYKFCNGSCCCYHYPSTVIVRYSFKICTFPLPIRVDSIVIVAAAADALCLLIQAYFDCRLLLCSFNSIYVCLSFCLFQCFPFFSSNEIFTEFCSSFTAQSCIELLDYCFEHTRNKIFSSWFVHFSSIPFWFTSFFVESYIRFDPEWILLAIT